ncbi:MAG: deoxyguanosinetriphosphate triphosphohydrolase [Lachnospiraceae bacterium]|nr:deoxyguanosinetriphosphate triphosphohydrolase [Lachnospiraceae bacterium]
MNIRETMEQWERENLSPYASLSSETKGRDRWEEPCDIRPVYQRDRDRIIHCKAFRRLKHKTQVFLAPEGDHYRTRLTHTLEVSQIARTVAAALRLNESLTEAIALGHDLGHTPFGHAGEYILNEICEEGFSHYKQSVRVVEVLEKKGEGLNLTWEVRDGILNHRTSGNPSTLEGKIVRFSDKIAYINHDIDDAIRGKIIKENDIPKVYSDVLGTSVKERLDIMIHDIIRNSLDKPDIVMSPGVESAMKNLRRWMFENVYKNPAAKSEEYKAQQLIVRLYEYYMKLPEELPEEFIVMMEERGEKRERVVCDYIAGMSDSYAIDKFEELFVPKAWKV